MFDPIIALDDQSKEWDQNWDEEQGHRTYNLEISVKVSLMATVCF
jgi:hypothetical protein